MNSEASVSYVCPHRRVSDSFTSLLQENIAKHIYIHIQMCQSLKVKRRKGEKREKGEGGGESPAGHADICRAIILQMFTDVCAWPGASKHCGLHPKHLAALSTHTWRKQSETEMKNPEVTPSNLLKRTKPR